MSGRLRARAPCGGRLDVVLAALLPERSRSRLAGLVRAGRVEVEGQVVHRPGVQVAEGAAIVVELPPEAPRLPQPEDLPITVVHEDDDLVVVDKAPGMVVHPSPGHGAGTLVNALLHRIDRLSTSADPQRPGIVHRLDRGTSGLLVVAKHDRAHQALADQFARHTADRRYLALCLGVPDEREGTIRTRLGRHPRDRLKFASVAEGRLAVTHWRRLGARGRFSLIGCQLETGRTHQIRVHLAESGWPLVGDPLYGPRKPRLPAVLAGLVPPDRPMLHAWRLELTHPTKERRVVFTAPLPADMRQVLEGLELLDAVPEPAR